MMCGHDFGGTTSKPRGVMAELVEGARLLSEYTLNRVSTVRIRLTPPDKSVVLVSQGNAFFYLRNLPCLKRLA